MKFVSNFIFVIPVTETMKMMIKREKKNFLCSIVKEPVFSRTLKITLLSFTVFAESWADLLFLRLRIELNSMSDAGRNNIVRAKAKKTPAEVKTPRILTGRMLPVINEKKPTPVVRLVRRQGSHTDLAALWTAST